MDPMVLQRTKMALNRTYEIMGMKEQPALGTRYRHHD